MTNAESLDEFFAPRPNEEEIEASIDYEALNAELLTLAESFLDEICPQERP